MRKEQEIYKNTHFDESMKYITRAPILRAKTKTTCKNKEKMSLYRIHHLLNKQILFCNIITKMEVVATMSYNGIIRTMQKSSMACALGPMSLALSCTPKVQMAAVLNHG